MKIAAIAYQIERLADWAAHSEKLDKLITDADADLIVLPEYAAIEAALIDGPVGGSAQDWRDRASDVAHDWVNQFRTAAQRHNVHIVAGSGPVKTRRGVVNRSWLIAPSGNVLHQDKMILTPFERDDMGMIAGDNLRVFHTALGVMGILICYDSEFPLLARALTAAGAEVLLVPAATDFAAGQTRVRQSCRARAIENQCLVVHAPLVGNVADCDVVAQSNGRAALFCPPDTGLPEDGIIAQGPAQQAGAVVADVDPNAIAAARYNGQVGNFTHWQEQDSRLYPVTLQQMDPINP
ncbi:carbon-nitrogen hydrolase family protein [Aestuariibius sp. HNIBRBA575]|uniref:carbon-nitrogen hydrolase family protein n=1 Tax=Aestuariibius sp. HNIBRBA575 TaxID=3233343 RepID=UPI0034A360DE